MKPRHVMTTALLGLFLSGCYTVKFADPNYIESEKTYSQHSWTHSLFWGLIPLGKQNLAVCGDGGIKKMKSQVGGLGLIAYWLTAGIWTPMHVKVVCGGAPGAPVAE